MNDYPISTDVLRNFYNSKETQQEELYSTKYISKIFHI